MKRKFMSMLLMIVFLFTLIEPLNVQAAKVKKASITSAKNSTDNSVTLKFKNISGANGYQITYATDKYFKNNKKSVTVKSNKKTIKNLKVGQTYYFKVRAYRYKSTKGKNYGKYSTVKKVKINRGIRKISLNKTVSGTLKKGNSSHIFKITHKAASVYGIKITFYSNYGKQYEWILKESDGNILFDNYLMSTDSSVGNRTTQNSSGWFTYSQPYSSHHSTGTYSYTLSVPEYMFADGMDDFQLKYKLELNTSIPYPYY